jgi:hypothetical protein
METKFAVLKNFIEEHKVDINYFYSIHIMSDHISLQGYDNKHPKDIGFKFVDEAIITKSWIVFNFEYQSVNFKITLT